MNAVRRDREDAIADYFLGSGIEVTMYKGTLNDHWNFTRKPH